MKTSSAEEEADIEFKRAFLVYAMAKTYELAGLQQLAMQKIEHHSMKMNVFDVLEALNDDFSKLQDQCDWFQDYLNEKIKVAFEEDYTTFAKNDFFDRISNEALNNFVVRHVIELFSSKVSCLLNTEKEVIQKISDEYVPDAPHSPVEEASARISVAIEEAPVTDCFIHEIPTQECSVPECPVPECAIPECSVPEYSVLECSVPECWTGNPPVEEAPVQRAFIEETVAANTVNAVSIEQAPVTNETLSEGDERGLLSNKATKKKKKDVTAIIDKATNKKKKDITATIDKAKKKKKEDVTAIIDKAKKKKKEDVTAINDKSVPEPPLEHEKPDENDLWSFSFGNAWNKEKGKNGSVPIEDTFINPEPAYEPALEPEPEAVEEDAVLGSSSFSASKKKNTKKTATKVVEDKANMEELAPPPLEPALIADDGWGTSTIPDKKKKSKKSAKALVTKPSSSHSELELGTEQKSEKKDKLGVDWDTTTAWSFWKTTATREKKGDSKDKEEPQATVASTDDEQDDVPPKAKAITNESNISTAPAYPDTPQVENGDTLQALKPSEEAVETHVSSHSHSGFQAESEQQPVKIEDGICPNRAKHLLEGDQWKTCRQCRAVLRQVAIQLVNMGHHADENENENENENEYEIVDHILTSE